MEGVTRDNTALSAARQGGASIGRFGFVRPPRERRSRSRLALAREPATDGDRRDAPAKLRVAVAPCLESASSACARAVSAPSVLPETRAYSTIASCRFKHRRRLASVNACRDFVVRVYMCVRVVFVTTMW